MTNVQVPLELVLFVKVLKIHSSIMKAEMASEIFNEKEYGTKVKCSANYCYYNKDEECTAKQIKVGIEGAQYRSETECDTFKSK